MIRFFLTAMLTPALATPALAGTLFVAKLEQPMTQETDFIANKAIWRCEADTCRAELRRKSPTVRTCKQVSEEIGHLTAFSSERGSLSQD